MTQPLRIEGLDVALDGHPVLRGLDLAIDAGSFTAVLGASGCGKTTLLRSIAGFAAPQRGRIEIAGQTVTDAGLELIPAEARGLGVVFQDYALFPHLDVRANVGFGIKGPESAARIDEMLALVRLEGLADRRPAELSGGQQQRVALARALAPRPALLLLDEPFANLDATLRGAVADELRTILGRSKTAALMVTHDREEALGLADQIVVLGHADAGQESLRQVGTPEEVYRRPRSSLVARTTGPVSIVKATVANEGSRARSAFGDFPLAVATDAGQELSLFIRPEDLEAQVDSAGAIEVRDLRFEGRGWQLLLRPEANADDESLRVESPLPLKRGERVRLAARRPLSFASRAR
jgi:iron(III) transport system ATP-binding protein